MVSGWGSWSTNGVQDYGLSLRGQGVNIDNICTAQNPGQICVGNPSATTQKDFTFDDGMPLSCKGPQKHTQEVYILKKQILAGTVVQ